MRRSTSIALAVAAAAVLATVGGARAQQASLQAQVAASLGYTDNVLSAPSSPMGFQPGPVGDAFLQVRPAIILTVGTLRSVQRFDYTLVTDLYLLHPRANTFTGNFNWLGFFQTSKVTQLTMGATFAFGRVNTFSLATDPASPTLSQLPPGGVTFFSGAVTEGFIWDASPQWRMLQSFRWSTYVPIEPRLTPATFDLDMHLGLERVFQRDAIDVDLRNDHAHFMEVRDASNNVTQPSRDVLINGLVGRWRHDYGHWWNTQLDVGVIEASRLASPTVVLVHPTALAAVRYLAERGIAELRYEHNVVPNLIVAQTSILDQVSLRGTVPFDKRRQVLLSSSVAYQYARQVDFDTHGAGSSVSSGFNSTYLAVTHAIVVDASLTYMPRSEIQLFARYQLYHQIAEPNPANPMAPPTLPTFMRNVIMFGLVGTYPGDPGRIVPTRAMRVDRTDALVMPEPHSEPQPKK